MAQHRNWHSTALCDCPWDKGALPLAKEAGKLHDFLMNPKSRPDLQTPEAQEFLKRLEQHYHSDKTDPLMPWLTREWKKGRLGFRQNPEWNDDNLWHLGTDGERVPLTPFTPAHVNHIADWYGSEAPNRQGHDIMKSTAWDVHNQKVPEWESWMREEAKKKDFEAAKSLGHVLHQYDDGWTVRQLPPEALEYEGWAMRGKPQPGYEEGVPICVGDPSYRQAVRNGDTSILSLRDPTGQPHVTAEVTPYTGPGETDDGYYEWPTFEHDVANHAFLKKLGDSDAGRLFLNHMRAIHRESPNTPDYDLHLMYGPEDGRINPTEGDPAGLYTHLRHDYATWFPSMERGQIEQIQGKGNSIPKDEYQQRMKEYFQTFPEETRPNWDYPEDDIDSIHGIVPDANPGYGVDGRAYEPEGEYEGGGLGHGMQGGYGPHGDYGLVKPERNIDYHSVLNSLARAPSHYQADRGDYTYHENEGHALYDEAKKRGEIPQLAKAFEDYHGAAMDSYNRLREMNWDYLGSYPGESWDEDPEQWLHDESGEQRTPEEAQEAWQEARDHYEYGENELYNMHTPSQVSNHMYKLLNPHYDASQQAYVNEEQPQPPEQTVAKVAAFRLYSNKDVKPAYYRWVYSPANGDVDLAHNWKSHPAEVTYHAQMAADRNEPGLVHGYAYRIHGGWRLTDWDHRPVADPYVVARVIAALRDKEGVRQAPVTPDSPKSAGLDWDRVHYGLPQPIVED